MLACNRALWQPRSPAPQPQHCDPARDGGRAESAEARVIGARLRAAARVLPEDSDAAALLLDGAIAAIAALWLARAGLDVPVQALQPVLVDRGDPLFGLRLRLALRAPSVEARLAYCRELLRLIAEDEGDKSDVS